MSSVAPPDKVAPGWSVATATALGAVHSARGMPVQDAVAVIPRSGTSAASGPLATAVADGHGHSQHFRSAKGSEFAVALACTRAMAMGATVAGLPDGDQVKTLASTTLVPDVLDRWRAAVLADLEANPVTAEELAFRDAETPPAADPFLAYGTTLLVALVAGRWVLLLQIGDGDVLAVTAEGRALTPVPTDPSLDGHRTTSMCQPDALLSFRYAVIDQEATPLSIVMLASDGYGNAQVADPWQGPVGEDLHKFLLDRGDAWVRDALPTWVSRCASSAGSGDDTTIALAIGPAPPVARRPSVESRSLMGASQTAVLDPPTVPLPRQLVPDDRTMPGRPRERPIRLGGGGSRPPEVLPAHRPTPARIRRRGLIYLLGAAVLAAVAATAFAVFPRPPTPTPTPTVVTTTTVVPTITEPRPRRAAGGRIRATSDAVRPPSIGEVNLPS